MPFLPLLFTLCVILSLAKFQFHLSLSRLSLCDASLKSIVFTLTLLISWQQTIYPREADIWVFLSPPLFCFSLFFILPLHPPWAKGDCNICQCIPSGALSLSPLFLYLFLFLSWCLGLRSESPAIWVGEQRRAEYPGNDQWAVSQILGDYQCTEWDHKPDGVWWEFARVKWVVCVCDCTSPCSFFSVFKCVSVCVCVFAHTCVSVGEQKKDWQWCFRGHAYGGLAVMHGCGWMAPSSEFQLLIMTDLYPATALSFFTLLLPSFSLSCSHYVFHLQCVSLSWLPFLVVHFWLQ